MKKRLALNRETLRRLQAGSLNGALGQSANTSQLCEEATHCECGTGTDCLPATAVAGGCSHTDDWLCW